MPAVNKKYNFDVVYDTQKVYRLILTAMANPTVVVNIKAIAGKFHDENQYLLTLAITILDNEVSFSVFGNSQLADSITSLTLSRQERLENADFIFVTEESDLCMAISAARYGTLADPHRSALLIVKNADNPSCRLCLHGPGINGTASFLTTELVKKAIDLRDSQYYEYPQGIDFIFLNDDGDLFAIPRLTRLEVR